MQCEDRILFFSDTPFQVVNATNAAIQLRQSADLIVYKQFGDADFYVDKAMESGTFDQVYSMEKIPDVHGWERRLDLFSVWMKRSSFEFDFDSAKYGTYMVACPSRVSNMVARQLRHDVRIAFYEDGTGTYSGRVFRSLYYPERLPDGVDRHRPIAEIQRLLLRALPKPLSLVPQAIYAYRPELIQYDGDFSKLPMAYAGETTSMYSSDELNKAVSAYSRDEEGYTLFFDGPRNTPADREAAQSVISDLREFGKSVLVKPHPRTIDPLSLYAGTELFPSVQWELFVSLVRIDDWTLVGGASTAMVSPAIIFNQHPRLLLSIPEASELASGTEAVIGSFCKLAEMAYAGNEGRLGWISAL